MQVFNGLNPGMNSPHKCSWSVVTTSPSRLRAVPRGKVLAPSARKEVLFDTCRDVQPRCRVVKKVPRNHI